jgi:hypothetical protein
VRFSMPNFPCGFDLPDEWWLEAGMETFTKTSQSYVSQGAATTVPLVRIEPPYRLCSVPKDWSGFDKERLVNVLRGIAMGADLPPVPLAVLPAGDDLTPAPYTYRVRDGFHRFFASIAAGYVSLPVVFPGFPADGTN